MMQWGTWLSIAILGPGAIIVFIWFLRDVRLMFAKRDESDD